MKKLILVILVAGLLVGCGDEAQKEVVEGEGEEKAAQTDAKDDPSVPIMIPCEACREDLSKRSTTCPNCGHPTPASIVAYKKAQERARIRAEEEERQRLAADRPAREKQLVDYKAGLKKIGEKPFTVPGLNLEMLWCPPGTFTMGSPANEAGRGSNETQHAVTLTEGVWLGKHEVTQAQWEEVMGNNPSHFKGANLPVEKVSWDDATAFCKKLTEREKKAGRLPAGLAYALPTEAQWEYACRAGTRTAYSFGNAITEKQANFKGTNDNIKKTTPVGSYGPNAWGFHDMHGNVWEWCSDWYGGYPKGAMTDPTGPAVGSLRVIRGGSWFIDARYLRSAFRSWCGPVFRFNFLGFRPSLRLVQGRAE